MKKHVYILLIIIALVAIFYCPIVNHPDTLLPFFSSSDEPLGLIWEFWTLQNYLGEGNIRYTNMINYPFGMETIPATGYFSYVWFELNYILSTHFDNLTLVWNIQIFTNFFLTGLFMYLLTFHLTRNRISALFSGIVFSFSPQHFVRSWQHLGLTYFQWIPLILLAAILLKEKTKRVRVLLFLFSILFLFSFDYSIMYLGMVSLVTFLIYIIFYNWKIKFFKKPKLIRRDVRYIGKIFIIGLIAFLILLPQFYPIIRNYFNPSLDIGPSGFNPYHRPFEDLFTQSAKPLSYLLPSTEHPIFGNFTKHFVGSHLWGVSFTEHQLYLGITTIVLAFIAFRYWRKLKCKKSEVLSPKSIKNKQEEKDKFYIGYFIFLAIVGWLFSQPPWWQLGSFKIYLPSFFMYKILPMYRAYCRFGIVVLFALAVLAGYGLKYIISRIKDKGSRLKVEGLKIITASVFCGLIIFEFWFNPLTHYIDLSKYPEVYDWLKKKPDNVIIVEYPMIKEDKKAKYLFYQTIHHKRLVNGGTIGRPGYEIKLKVVNLADKNAPSVLKSLGAKYVVVHTKDYEESENLKEFKRLERIRNHPDLELIKRFSDGIEVYEIRD